MPILKLTDFPRNPVTMREITSKTEQLLATLGVAQMLDLLNSEPGDGPPTC